MLDIQKRFSTNKDYKKKIKVKYHCHYTGKYRGAAHNICNLRYKIAKNILVVFHNGSTYNYHFLIKELTEEFEEQFECLGENTEKYITFSVLIKREPDNGKSITYKIMFIDSFRFMSSSLSNLADNLSEELQSKMCTNCKSCLDYVIPKDDQLIFRCFECKIIKRFANICKFCNGDINEFALLLRKGIYPYEYMDYWERFDETSFPDKRAFYSSINIEDITDVAHRHIKTVLKKS